MIGDLVSGATLCHVRLSPSRRAKHIMGMPASIPPNRLRKWTAAEVRQLIADAPLGTPRYELVDGELLVTPSPKGVHQQAVGLLLAALVEYLRRNPVGRAYTSPFDVELEPGSVLQPDILVAPMEEAKRLLTEMPARELLLACEVLFPSSARHDRVKKRPVYGRHVPEYWVVDTDARVFERWRAGEAHSELVTETLEWHPAGAAEPFRLDVVRYFAEIFHEL